MTVGAVTSNAATQDTDTGKAKSGLGAAAGLGKDDFMQLLIAQLRNQDPMKPMEDKEFIAQLATFSSLEATEKMASQLEELTGASMIVQAATLIGKQVTAKLTTGEMITGTVSQVKMVSGQPVAVVNGTDIDTSLITVIGAASSAVSTSAASTNAAATNAPAPNVVVPYGTAPNAIPVNVPAATPAVTTGGR